MQALARPSSKRKADPEPIDDEALPTLLPAFAVAGRQVTAPVPGAPLHRSKSKTRCAGPPMRHLHAEGIHGGDSMGSGEFYVMTQVNMRIIEKEGRTGTVKETSDALIVRARRDSAAAAQLAALGAVGQAELVRPF